MNQQGSQSFQKAFIKECAFIHSYGDSVLTYYGRVWYVIVYCGFRAYALIQDSWKLRVRPSPEVEAEDGEFLAACELQLRSPSAAFLSPDMKAFDSGCRELPKGLDSGICLNLYRDDYVYIYI